MNRLLSIVIIVVITVSTPCFAKSDSAKKVQKASTTKTEKVLQLANVHDILVFEKWSTTIWNLGIKYQKYEYIKSNTEVIEDFRTWLLKEKDSGYSSGLLIGRDEVVLFNKYAKNIEELISEITVN